METGLNDASCVVWAISKCFYFIFFLVLIKKKLYLGTMSVIKGRKGLGKTMMTKTGPNDARHVVWALGE